MKRIETAGGAVKGEVAVSYHELRMASDCHPEPRGRRGAKDHPPGTQTGPNGRSFASPRAVRGASLRMTFLSGELESSG